MRSSTLVRDLGLALGVIASLVLAYSLLMFGVGLLFVIGFTIPGWILLIGLLMIVTKKFKQKKDSFS